MAIESRENDKPNIWPRFRLMLVRVLPLNTQYLRIFTMICINNSDNYLFTIITDVTWFCGYRSDLEKLKKESQEGMRELDNGQIQIN